MLSQEILEDCALCDAIMVRNRPERLCGLSCIPFRLIIDHIFTYLEFLWDIKAHVISVENDNRTTIYKKISIEYLYGYFSIDRFRKIFLLWKRVHIYMNSGFSIHHKTILNHQNSLVEGYTLNVGSSIKNISNIVLPQNILSIKSNIDILNLIRLCPNLDMINTSIERYNQEHWLNGYFPNLKFLTVSINYHIIDENVVLDFVENNSSIMEFSIYDRAGLYTSLRSPTLVCHVKLRSYTKNKFMNLTSSDNYHLIPLRDVQEYEYPLIYSCTIHTGITIQSQENIIRRIAPKTLITNLIDLQTLNINEISIIYPVFTYLQIDEFINFNLAMRNRFVVCPCLCIDNINEIPFPFTWSSIIENIRRRIKRLEQE